MRITRFRIKAEKSLVTQNSIIYKSVSAKFIHPKDPYEYALEERFREFLRPKRADEFSSISSIIHLLDELEREIRDELGEVSY